jgi:hypothetical protein
MKKWITYALVFSITLGNTAFAQTAVATELRAGQNDIGAVAPKPVQLNRYTYSLPNHAPCVSNLDKLFPGVTRMTGKEYVEIMDGKKGELPKKEFERCIGMAFYTDPAALAKGEVPDSFPVPDPAFLEALHDRLAHSEYEQKVYQGLDCKVENGKFAGDCNSDLTGVMAYRNTVTQLPPTMVGFSLGALVLGDVEIINGPRNGEWVRPVVTSYVVVDAPKRNNVTGRLYQVEQPCANWTSEDGQAPVPAPVAAAVPAPVPVVVPPPAPAPRAIRTTDLVFYKEFWKGDKPVKELPKNAESVKFEATVDQVVYPAYVLRRTSFTRRDAGTGQVLEGERLEMSVPNVALANANITAMIREVSSPDGWKAHDKNQVQAMVIPPNGRWMELTRVNEPPIFRNDKKPCRALGLPCWAWIPIGAAVVTPFLIPHHPPTTTPQPIACNPAVTKCGGPGASPQ